MSSRFQRSIDWAVKGRKKEQQGLAAISIGVPVYNGGEVLDQSLACLARQTFGDFEVEILDNASTDNTGEIAQAWASRDHRFHYHRQHHNVGGVLNFRDALLASNAPWFLWRAHDDLSADNYLEALYSLASKAPVCDLVVSTVLSVNYDLSPTRVQIPSKRYDPSTVVGRLHGLFGAGYTPCWCYGLWRRDVLTRAFLPLVERYPYAFASDHLLLYGPIIEGVVLATTETHFISRNARPRPPDRPRERKRFSVMWDIRRSFVRELRRIRGERKLSPQMRLAVLLTQPLFLRRTQPSLTKMIRTGIRELLGIAGPRSTSWHIERRP